jgi:hypothetical protein
MEAHRRADVVRGVARLELIEEPDLLLGEGKGRIFDPGTGRDHGYKSRLLVCGQRLKQLSPA